MKFDPPVIAAGITGLIALVVAVWTALWTRRTAMTTEKLKAALADQSKERNARLDYEYEARKRLYQELEPLLFRLVDASDEAWHRVLSLARSARFGKIAPDHGWLWSRGYYLMSTVYKLLVPMAVIRLFEEKLTFVDLAVEPRLRDQYFLAKTLDRSFTGDHDLKEKTESYEPDDHHAEELRETEPARYWRQGLYIGAVDIAAAALIVRTDGSPPRIMRYGEFEQALRGRKTDAFEPVFEVFLGFHPETRPLLWRILLAQAAIYKSFVALRTLPRTEKFQPLRTLSGKELDLLAWNGETADAELKRVAARAQKHVGDTFRSIASN
jgi:hypothetical protein